MAVNRSLTLIASSRSANHMIEDPCFLGAFAPSLKLRRNPFSDSPLLPDICLS